MPTQTLVFFSSLLISQDRNFHLSDMSKYILVSSSKKPKLFSSLFPDLHMYVICYHVMLPGSSSRLFSCLQTKSQAGFWFITISQCLVLTFFQHKVISWDATYVLKKSTVFMFVGLGQQHCRSIVTYTCHFWYCAYHSTRPQSSPDS